MEGNFTISMEQIQGLLKLSANAEKILKLVAINENGNTAINPTPPPIREGWTSFAKSHPPLGQEVFAELKENGGTCTVRVYRIKTAFNFPADSEEIYLGRGGKQITIPPGAIWKKHE